MSKKPTLRSTIALLRGRIAVDEEGATAIEYALMASGIAVAVSATVWSVGSTLKTNFYDSIAALF
jgi:pilus assembly protein Flp/PilA